MPLPENDRLVRKLRKKLRQIEHLEIVDRELNYEELDKVGSKDDIRRELTALLEASRKEEEEMKRSSQTEASEAVKTKAAKLAKDGGSTRSQTSAIGANAVEIHSLSSCSLSSPPVAESLVGRVDNAAPESGVAQLGDVLGCSHQVEVRIANPDNVSGNSQEVSSSSCLSGLAGQPRQLVKATTDNDLQASATQAPTSVHSQQMSTDKQRSSADTQAQQSSANAQRSSADSQRSSTAKPRSSADKQRSAKQRWRQLSWEAAPQLQVDEGHADLILDCDVDVSAKVVITASRDTSLKVWNLTCGSLVHSLRGHTGPVTGVRILTSDASRNLAMLLDEDVQQVAVSSSKDCCIKLWNLSLGVELKSIYTFNGISRLQILAHRLCSVTGTDGGKLEIFSLSTGLTCFSSRAHEDEITALSYRREAERELLASGSRSGQLKLFLIAEDAKSLSCIFSSDNIACESLETSLHLRPVYSTAIGGGGRWLFYGDDGCNIKAVDWRMNRIRKIVNHVQDVGFTDCVLVTDQLLVATSYDLDTGEGMVNLFMEQQEEVAENLSLPCYLATISQLSTTRITSMAASQSEDGLVMVVSCGREVKVWQGGSAVARGGTEANNNSSSVLRCCVLSIERSRVVDSGSEEEDEEEERTATAAAVNAATSAAAAAAPSKAGSGFCNCRLM